MFNAKDKISTKGNENLTVGRDLVFQYSHNEFGKMEISSELRAKFNSMDKLIAEKIGSIHSPRNASKIEYSSNRLCQSLTMLSIPLDIAVKITLEAPTHILEVFDRLGIDNFSTSHIRQIVAELILKVPVEENQENLQQEWASRYARKYGNASEQIKITLEDDNEECLSYNFLVKSVFPEIIRKLLFGETNTSTGCDDDYTAIITTSHIREMASCLLENVKRLDLYSISKSTLYALAEDLAIQPPHPWFVRSSKNERIYRYDYERACKHLELAKNEKLESESSTTTTITPIFWQHIGECIHHSCSSILSYYGMFLGSSYLSPAKTLRTAITRIEREENLALWNFCILNSLAEDMKELGKSESSLRASIDAILRLLKQRSTLNKNEALEIANEIFLFSKKLIRTRKNYDLLIRMHEEKDLNFKASKVLLTSAIKKSNFLRYISCSERGIILKTSIRHNEEFVSRFNSFPIFIDANHTTIDDIHNCIERIMHKRLSATCILVGKNIKNTNDYIYTLRDYSFEHIFEISDQNYIEFLKLDLKSIFFEKI